MKADITGFDSNSHITVTFDEPVHISFYGRIDIVLDEVEKFIDMLLRLDNYGLDVSERKGEEE